MSTAMQPKMKFSHDESQRRVRHPLQIVRRYISLYIILEGLALTFLAGVLIFWVGLAFDFGLYHFDFGIFHGVDWILEFNEIDASGLSSLGCRIIVLTAVIVGLLAYGFMKVVLRWLRDFNDRAIALVLERRFPKELGDRLITAVELANPKLSVKYGFSQDMVEKTIMEAVDAIKKLPVFRVFNWRRLFGLWFLLGFLSIGTWVATMVVFTASTAAFADKWMNPWEFSWKFYDVAAIWTERNLLMTDTYWPRRSHLEIDGFQPSKEDPNDMRVPHSDKRPELRVRAFEWVIADRDRAKAPYGWRPLRWDDLPNLKLIDKSAVDAVAIPKDFPYWRLELDELEPDLVGAIFDSDMITISSGEMRAHLKKEDVKKKVRARGAEAKLEAWLDWTTWTVDKLKIQSEQLALRQPMVVKPALMASTVGHMAVAEGPTLAAQGILYPKRTEDLINYEPVEKLFSHLETLAQSPWLSRTIRKLDIPRNVHIHFKGDPLSYKDAYPRQDGNKYNVSLEPLKESSHFKFRARGENYFTPRKSITLIAAPTPAIITTDTEEPAYIYHRIHGVDQMSLRGLTHVNKDLGRTTAGESNDIRVALGSKVAINVIIDNSPVIWGSIAVGKIRPTMQAEYKLPDDIGVVVTSVETDSPVQKAGLAVGDVIFKINGNHVPGDLELFAMNVEEYRKNDVAFTLLRKDDGALPKGGGGAEGAKGGFREDTLNPVTMTAAAQYSPRRLRADRPVFVVPPIVIEGNYEPYPGKPAVIHKDRLGFTLSMENITRNHEFVAEFYDEDNIRGKRRFRIDRVIDSEPLVGNLSVFGYTPRRPKFRTLAQQPKEKEKDKDKKEQGELRDYSEFTNAYLITPDARIPFDCKVLDDYGLVRVGYHYKYRKVDFELVSYGSSKKLPVLEVDQDTRRFHANLAASNFMHLPTNPISWHAAPNYLAWSAITIQRDVNRAQGYTEGLVASEGFNRMLEREAFDMVRPEDVKARLAGHRASRQWEFDFKSDSGLDLQVNLKGVKASPLDDIGQLHYLLQVAVQATDNNVETGVPYIQEIDAVADDGAKIKKLLSLRGNTRKNANGYVNFIIVSENELLAQIALEEEGIREKLEAAKDKVDGGMVSLLDQLSKVQKPDAELEGILNRMNEIRTGLQSAGNVLTDAQSAYDNILKEMEINRIKSDKIKTIQGNIITRLDYIVMQPDPKYPAAGTLTRAQDAFQKAHQVIDDETNNKKAPDVETHRKNMLAAHAEMKILSEDIQRVLDAMSEGIVESKLIAIIAGIEQEQRKHSQFLFREKLRLEEEILKELLDPKGKSKDKKTDPEGKKSSRLESDINAPHVARARDVAAELRLPQLTATLDEAARMRIRQRMLTAYKQ